MSKQEKTILDAFDDEPDRPSDTPAAAEDADGWSEGGAEAGAGSGEADGWAEGGAEATPEEDAGEEEAGGEELPGDDPGDDASTKPEPAPIMKDGATTYVVQRGFTVDGKTYHPGDTILVKCKYCALWNKEWGGKVRCQPGKEWSDGTKMTADKYSCESFFICKELEGQLDAFLSMNLPEVLTVRRMMTAAKQLLSTEPWVRKHFGAKPDTNPAAVFLNAKGFITSFTNVDQLVLSEDFIRTYANMMAAKEKARARLGRSVREKKVVFGRGDWVEWTDVETKQLIKGIVLYLSKGNIHIAGVDGTVAGQNFTFPLKEWKEKRSPRILRKAASTDGE